MIASLALKMLRHHWLSTLSIFGLYLLALGLAAGLPLLDNSLSRQAFMRQLANQPAGARTIALLTPLPELNDQLLDPLRDLIALQVPVQQAQLVLNPEAHSTANGLMADNVGLWTIEGLEAFVNVDDGRWPESGASPLEVALGWEAARRSGWAVGDRLAAAGGTELLITALVSPQEPLGDLWLDDLSPFDMQVTQIAEGESTTLSLLLTPDDIRRVTPTPSQSRRVLLDHEVLATAVLAGTSPSPAQRIRELQEQLQPQLVNLASDVPAMTEEFLAGARDSRLIQRWLLIQGLLVIWLGLGAALLATSAHWRFYLEPLVVRGLGRRNQIALVGVSGGVLVGAACLIAVLGAQLAHWWLPGCSSESQCLAVDSWFLVGLTAVFGWAALMLAVGLPVTPYWPARQAWRARPSTPPRWQRWYLDLTLLLVSLGMSWQLRRLAGELSRGQGDDADILLLLAPATLAIAVLLLGWRQVPRLLGWWADFSMWRNRDLEATTWQRLARQPWPAGLALTLGLAMALFLLAAAVEGTAVRRLGEMARYQTGADIRIQMDDLSSLEISRFLADPPDGMNPAMVQRLQMSPPESNQPVEVVALESASFEDVARYPSGISNLTVPAVTRALRGPHDDGIPAVFSLAALPTDSNVGDQVILDLPGVPHQSLTFEVRGIISNFPAIGGRFVIVEQEHLAGQLPSGRLRSLARQELWLAWPETDRSTTEARVAAGPSAIQPTRVIAAQEELLGRYQANLAHLKVANTLQISGWALALFGVVLVLGVSFGDGPGQASVMTALGQPPWQWRQGQLLTGGGAILATLLLGLLVGALLIWQMEPLITLANGQIPGGSAEYTLNINWRALLSNSALLITLSGGALVVLNLRGLRRTP